MTGKVNYVYTDRDLLSEPETYEYSDVFGRPFLDAYLDDRAEILSYLDSRLVDEAPIDAEENWSGLLETILWAATESVGPYLPILDGREQSSRSSVDFKVVVPESLPDRSATGSSTMAVLSRLLGYPGDRPPDRETATVWLDRLVERFEVDKRLYSTYDADMSSVDNEPAPLAAYPMLALAALVHHNRSGNLKHLNVALKLCDLLSSRREQITSRETIALARLAIDEERGAVKALATSTGVSL